jgi:hypothetical protein
MLRRKYSTTLYAAVFAPCTRPEEKTFPAPGISGHFLARALCPPYALSMSAILTRRQPRRAFRRRVLFHCQVVREHDFRRVATMGVDLSTDGMLVMTHDRVLTGDELIVSFRAPRSMTWFDSEATVARVIHGRRPGDGGRALGIAFHGREQRWHEELFAFLRGLPPPRPLRSPRLGAVP